MSDVNARANRLRVLVEQEVAQKGSRVGQMDRLCQAVVRYLPASGAGISVSSGISVVVLAAAGHRAREVEELQRTLGEGPCIDVTALSRPVLEPDLLSDGHQRWPAYAAAAVALGTRAVFAFPLQVGASHLGVLDVLRDVPGSLDHEELMNALAFSDLARTMLLDDLDGMGSPGVGVDWNEVLPANELYQAQGMVMVQCKLDSAGALARIRAHCFSHDQRLGLAAIEIVAGRLAFQPDQPLEN